MKVIGPVVLLILLTACGTGDSRSTSEPVNHEDAEAVEEAVEEATEAAEETADEAGDSAEGEAEDMDESIPPEDGPPPDDQTETPPNSDGEI